MNIATLSFTTNQYILFAIFEIYRFLVSWCWSNEKVPIGRSLVKISSTSMQVLMTQ